MSEKDLEELISLIKTLHWKSKEEMEDYIKLLKERLNKIKNKKEVK